MSTPLSLRQSAGRSFPLVPILVAAVLMALCPIQTRANTIVFDTLGPGDTYEQLSGYVIIRTSPPGAVFNDFAAQFTAMTSVNLATHLKIDLGLTFQSLTTPGQMNVFLYGDAAGSPDDAMQTLLGTVTPTEAFGTTNNSLLSLVVSGVPLVQGTNYWLVLKPDVGHTRWNASLPAVTGSIAQRRNNDVTWFTFNDRQLPAFRISALGVPDSGGTLLIMLGSVAALLVLQRVLRNERSN